ncbi:hypothetical protein O3P69_013941 [Scylla paramamosain]|uniref:Uncharacterized protein n=1 Tax=Scylla paramamosain TaxID=85552 RepID=A0AAW0STR0_SCYPA
MQSSLVPLFLLLAANTLPGAGLAAEYHLKSCGEGGGSLIDHVLCDPDHLVQPVNRRVVIEVLTRCGEKTGHMPLVFLAATLPHDGDAKPTTTPITTTTTGTKQSSGGGGEGDGEGSRGIAHLKELVVAANNLTTTPTPVILLVGVREQMAMWWSDSLNGVLTNATIQEAQQNASHFKDHQLFIDATVQVAWYLCQSSQGSVSSWPVRYITLTVTWIAFTVCFAALLLAIAVILIKVRIQAQKTREERNREEAGQRTSRLTFPRASDIHNWSHASFKSTGHVLLGTTDIVAVPPHDCTSTDNLLENC